MTEEELQTIEARWFAVHTTYTTLPDGTETIHYGAQHRHAGHDIFALLDEVRRLRAENARVQAVADYLQQWFNGLYEQAVQANMPQPHSPSRVR